MVDRDAIEHVSRWRSLDALVALAEWLPGARDDGAELQRWFEVQLDRTVDPAFARRFTDHIDLPGLDERDYLHRVVEAHGLRLLAGIRFFGQDVSRPFVEAIAWTPLDGGAVANGESAWSAGTIDRLGLAIREAWRAFAPTHLRLHRPEHAPESAALESAEPESAALELSAKEATTDADGGSTLPTGWQTDVLVHAARTSDMRPDRGEVTLEAFDSVAEAVAIVTTRFETLRKEDPALARLVTPIDGDTLIECEAAGSLFAIRAGKHTVGLIATLPDTIDWIAGDTVMEEVVAREHAGHGHAAAAQRALAARLARDSPDRRLIGTIDGANVASRRTALRAGRPVVSRYAFVPL